ncbi:hypothetical protein Taro_056668 [Colocasia esculenta]|uniref:Uncharacterized protein n=1 Tax=Colocasia esculenta TaxID=4460 RepID=A0A843XX47_COLES|nr:hypothetical protein [Colocasia esculenta]
MTARPRGTDLLARGHPPFHDPAAGRPPGGGGSVAGRAGPCAADGGRGFLHPRGSRPLRLGGLASGGGGPSGGRPRPAAEAGAGAEDRPGADDDAGGGDGGAAPTPRGSGGGAVAPGGRAAARWQQEAAEATRWRQEAEEAARLRAEAGDLRTQLGEESHRGDMLRSKMRGLERALALVGRSQSATSRSSIPSGSAGHYLTGSSGRRRNEEEEQRRPERAPEGSETGPRVMAPPSPRPPEGTGESG